MKKIIALLSILVFFICQSIAQTVPDIDGNHYDTLRIGTQTWMKENLKTTRFTDGTAIPNVSTSWASLASSARCYYNNDSITYAHQYGALYNWYAVTDSRHLCPTGWHVPSDAEWTTLIDFAGSSPAADTMLCNGCQLGFDGKLGGILSAISGTFDNEGNFGYFWSSTEESTPNAWTYSGFRKTAPQMNNRDFDQKNAGLSVRCMKGSTVTAVAEQNNYSSLSTYPNPASEKVIVSCLENNQTLTLYSIDGSFLLEKKLMSGQNEVDIHLVPKGFYLMKIFGNGQTRQFKLLKN